MQTLVVIIAFVLCFNATAVAGISTSWSRFHDASPFNSPSGIASDSQHNVCVLVDSGGAVALVKYSPNGTALWTNRFDSQFNDIPGDFTIAADDSICVVLHSSLDTSPGQVVLLKYAPDGALLWSRSGVVTNVSQSNRPDVAADSLGNVFVSAVTAGNYTLVKHDPAGNPQWTNSYPLPSGVFPSTAFFGVDGSGNVVLVAGLISVSNDQLLVLKCAPDGAMNATIRQWPQPNDFLAHATMDSVGNLFVAANVTQAGRGYQVYAAKYDPAGSLIWSATRPPPSGFHHAVANRIAVDSSGNVIMTAYETYPASEDDDVYQTVTVKLNSSGNELWSARARGFDRRPTGLAIAQDDSIYVVAGESYGQSALLVHYLPGGSQTAELSASGHSPGQIAIGAPGEFYVNFSSRCETRKFVHSDSQPPLSVTIAPDRVEILPDEGVTLTALVSGAGPFTYDWRYQGLRTGESGNTFTIAAGQYQPGTVADFTVIVSNATTFAVSPQARVTVVRPPTVQLASVFLAVVGEPIVLEANVSGSEPITYSWFFNGRLLNTAISNQLVFPAVQSGDAGNYSLTVSNRAGIATSAVATLHVVQPPKTFSNEDAITIRVNRAATPYPSELVVSGVSNRVVKITATLSGLNHTRPHDLGILLQSPTGKNLVLMSGAADDTVASSVTLTFDDDAADEVPDELLYTGIFKPTSRSNARFRAPAPATERVNQLANLTNQDVNGTWKLYVDDQVSSSFETAGQLAGGWAITISEVVPDTAEAVAFTRVQREGNQLLLEWNASPGWRLQSSSSLLQPTWTDVPGATEANQIQLPVLSSNQFFRLTK